MLVELTDKLKPVEFEHITIQYLADKLSDREVDYKNKVESQSLFPVGDMYIAEEGCCTGYVDYLEQCYNAHRGIVISPDIVWQILLGELAAIIAKDPEKYRGLFTDSDGKKMITVDGVPDNPQWMTNAIIVLAKVCPTNVKLFIPEFSTTTDMSRISRYAMFCQAVSPYYDYSVYMCGLPSVDILGTEDDWTRLRASWGHLSQYFPDVYSYFDRVMTALDQFYHATFPDPASEFFKKFFYTESCGSGSDKEVHGWINQLFFKNKPTMSHNYPTGLARVDFIDLSNHDKPYQSVLGIMSSRDREDGVREPFFGHMLFEKREQEVRPYVSKPLEWNFSKGN